MTNVGKRPDGPMPTYNSNTNAYQINNSIQEV